MELIPPPNSKVDKPRPKRRTSGPRRGAKMLEDIHSTRLQKALVYGFWLFAAFAIINSLTGNLLGTLCGSLVIGCSLLPGYLWVTGIAKGYPIFPVFAFTYSYTYGMQMLLNRDIMSTAPADGIISACFSVSGFLLLATVIWLAIVKRSRRPPREMRMIAGRRSDITFNWIFGASAIFQVLYTAGWIQEFPRYYIILRAIMFSFGILAAFALSYHLGEGKLTPFMKGIFITFLAVHLVASAATLMLVQPLSLGLLSLIGFTIAAKRIPWKIIIIAIPIFTMMQYGKYALREKYWEEEVNSNLDFVVKPWEYPQLYAEWFASAAQFNEKYKNHSEVEKNSSLLQRSSLLQLYLLTYRLSPETIPHLKGETYKILPTLFIPRFFLPNKPASHEGTYILSIHYGLQTREDTVRTTIGWGLLNEAYANFAYLGVVMLAIVVGGFIGYVTYFSMGYPILSARGLLAVLVMNFSFQSEYSSGVFVSALFQSCVALLVLSFLIMENVRVQQDEPPPEPLRIPGKPSRRLHKA